VDGAVVGGDVAAGVDEDVWEVDSGADFASLFGDSY